MSAYAHATAKDSSAMPLQTPLAAKSQLLTNSSNNGLLLQRKCACGSPTASLTGECGDCKSEKLVQTKLTVGASNDPFEQEADRVADQVLAARPNPAVKVAPPQFQRFTGQPNASVGTAAPASVDRVLSSPGAPLEPTLRQDMEQRFGHDFSRVRVHSDAAAEQSARDVNAKAFTVGSHIVFGVGQYQMGSSSGSSLLAHELTHTIQQQSLLGCSSSLQRWPSTLPAKPLTPLEDVATRIGQLLRGQNFSALGEFRGPVLSVVRDDLGRIFIGLNEGVPPKLSEALTRAIGAQKARIAAGEVIVVRTSAIAVGGHAEVIALDRAIVAREKELGRVLTEVDLRGFELHNVWLSGEDRALTAAARCEHCARITRGVSVTDSVFHAEGGVSGTIDTTRLSRTRPVPSTPAARTASGEINVGSPGPGGPGAKAEHAAGKGGVKAEEVAAKALVKAEETAIKVEAKLGSRIALRVGRLGFSMLLPGPLDVIMMMVDFAGSYSEAWEIIEERNTRKGIAYGIAAGIMGIEWGWVTENLWRRFATRDVATQFIDAVGKAEKSFNDGLVRGHRYGAGHPQRMKNQILLNAFTALAKEGYETDEEGLGLFTVDGVMRVALLLLPMADDFLAKTAARKQARLKSERDEMKKGSWSVGNKI